MPTAVQRLAALQRANATRHANRALKDRIRDAGPQDGARLAAETVLLAAASLRFDELLRAVPGVGPVACRRMLGRAKINGALRVNAYGIADSRRQALVLGLKAWADGTSRR